MKGHLSPEDILCYKGARLTPFFVNRLFEEHALKRQDGGLEMDLEKFIKFILAWRERTKPAALEYLFPIFDIRKRGYLRGIDVLAFFKSVEELWVGSGQVGYPGMAEDVVNEIFDMIKPETPGRITKRDLRRSGMADTIFGIMVDVWEFWHHENRESQSADQDSET